MFKIGDIVTPIEGKIGHGYDFRISEIVEDNPFVEKYRLQRVTAKLNPMYGPVGSQLETLRKVEKFIWFENELTTNVYEYHPRIVGDSIQGNEPTPDYPKEIKNKNLFDGGIIINKPITINGSTNTKATEYVPCITGTIGDELKRTTVKIDNPIYNYYKNIKEDNMKILDIYKERKEQEIINNLIKEKEKVIQEDEIQKIVNEMKEQINVILENEGRNEKVDVEEPISSLLTNKTNKKIVDLEAKHIIAREKLHSTLEEIRALFELTEDYQERMKILKKYDIINKDGKVNV